MDCLLVMTACPSQEVALELARRLVQDKLAACVNIVPGVHSVYRWQDAIEETREVMLVIKSTAANYAALESVIHSVHPYQVPEVLAVPITQVAPQYRSWLKEACHL